jgi:hypothetical protein
MDKFDTTSATHIFIECVHTVDLKVEGGKVITFCTKCGAILDIRPVTFEVR